MVFTIIKDWITVFVSLHPFDTLHVTPQESSIRTMYSGSHRRPNTRCERGFVDVSKTGRRGETSEREVVPGYVRGG